MLNTSQDQEDKSGVSSQQHIIVSIRIRPLSTKETDWKELLPWSYDESSIKLFEDSSIIYDNTSMNNCNHTSNSIKQSFKFDHIFHPTHTNEYIYSSMVQKIVYSSMNGYHGTIFTYGQTSSGKTFTMNGDSSQIGIMFQAINDCFDQIHSYQNREFLLRMSYLEVYNEQIKDLLNTDPTLIKLQYDAKLQCAVLSGVKEQVILNPQQAFSLITAGEAHRHVGSTDMNEKSSRAHTLLKIIIESKESIVPSGISDNDIYSSNNNMGENNLCGGGIIRTSTLYLVDLAGSESAKMTNSKGQRAKEAKHINQSLLTLSTIIQRLSEEKSNTNIISTDNSNTSNNNNSMKRSQHLPYRDSKLTRILENALDGNAHIGMICTISPTMGCIDESLNTLKFASRAKLIKIGAKINETIDDKTLLRAYRDEIEQLRSRLKLLETSSSYQNSSSSSSSIHNNYIASTNLDDISDGMKCIDRDDEDGEAIMLQMISEIERLIIKADISKSPLKSTNVPPTQTSADTIATAPSSIVVTSSLSNSIPTMVINSNNNPMTITSTSLQQRETSIKNSRVSAIPIRYDYYSEIVPSSQSTEVSCQDTLTSVTANVSDSLMRRTSRLIPKGTFRVRSTTDKVPEPLINLMNIDSKKFMIRPTTSTSIQNEMEPQVVPILELSEQVIVTTDKLSSSKPSTTAATTNTANIITQPTVTNNNNNNNTTHTTNDEVLVGVVSKMLALLKGQLAKSYHRNTTPLRPISPPSENDILDIMNISSNTKNQIELLPMVEADGSLQASFDPTHESSLFSTIPRYHYQQLLLDLKLKDADNRFLQEELDNKDQMLQMLIDGLKEIEQSQNLWLNRNQELSYELQRVMSQNTLLQNEVDELKKKLKKN